jgi:DNA-directed RNA polymerase subunit omega
MARVTTEDCLATVNNHFALVIVAAERARQLSRGAVPLVVCTNRAAVTSLREIALGRVSLREPLENSIRAHIADRERLEGERKFSNGRRRT